MSTETTAGEAVTLNALMGEVAAELARAWAKFPTWPTDPLHALAVLGEEYGELTKDMLQLCYEPHKTTRENVRKEAMQTAAMAMRLAVSLDAYEYRPGLQHSQAPYGPRGGCGTHTWEWHSDGFERCRYCNKLRPYG
jgi:hypothetical protein